MIPEDHRIQSIALFLIVLAVVCIGMGERYNMAQLVGFSLTFGGGGLGILTGQRLTQNNNTKSGAINAPTGNPTDPNAAPGASA